MTIEHPEVVVSRAATWTAAGATDRGRARHANEDCFVMHAEAGVFVVCDGMGGAAAGGTASQLAAEAAVDLLSRDADMRAAVAEANRAVFERSRQDRRLDGMGTTMVALALGLPGSCPGHPGSCLGHVGDSRCYRWRGARLEQLTTDHSLVEEQIILGRMTREEARRSPMQHMITRAVGTRPQVAAEVRELEPERGDLYLLCSDGLTRELTDGAIEKMLRQNDGDPAAACAALVSAANAAGGRDNITCVLVRIEA